MGEWDDDLEEWEYPEPDDEPDNTDTITCPHCGSEVYEDAVQCSACGTWLAATDRLARNRLSLVTWAVLIVFVLAMCLVLARA